jgi:cytochrome c553
MRIPGKTLALMWMLALPALGEQRNFEYCTVCHGANGNGNPAIHAPRIAGLEPWYLRNQFIAFKAGWRGTHPDDAAGNEMRPVAAALSPAEVDQVIAYVATFVAKPPPLTVSGDVAHGKTLYAVCTACHGERGEGKAALHAPALTNRTDWYLVTQLRDYRSGLRGGNQADASGQQMRAIAASLSGDYAINDVVSYINSLR